MLLAGEAFCPLRANLYSPADVESRWSAPQWELNCARRKFTDLRDLPSMYVYDIIYITRWKAFFLAFV